MDTTRPKRLRRDEASAYLKREHDLTYAPRTLTKLACIGGGPQMEYGGRFPLYPVDALDAWARSKISPRVNSTSELKTLRAA